MKKSPPKEYRRRNYLRSRSPWNREDKRKPMLLRAILTMEQALELLRKRAQFENELAQIKNFELMTAA